MVNIFLLMVVINLAVLKQDKSRYIRSEYLEQ